MAPPIKNSGDKILYRCGEERKKRINKYCVDGVTQKQLLDAAIDNMLDRIEQNGGSLPVDPKPKKEPPLPSYLKELLDSAPPPDASPFQMLIYEDRVKNALAENELDQ